MTLRLLELYLRGVEALLAELPAAQRASLAYQHTESRTRFLRELLEEQYDDERTTPAVAPRHLHAPEHLP